MKQSFSESIKVLKVWAPWPRILQPKTQWPTISTYKTYASNSLEARKHNWHDICTYSKKLFHTLHKTYKIREESLVWKYKLLVIESWAKESWALEFTPCEYVFGVGSTPGVFCVLVRLCAHTHGSAEAVRAWPVYSAFPSPVSLSS